MFFLHHAVGEVDRAKGARRRGKRRTSSPLTGKSQAIIDLVKNAFKKPVNVFVLYPENIPTQRLQGRIPACVARQFLILCVGSTVDFDSKPRFHTSKVENVAVDRMLTPKLPAAALARFEP